MRVLHIVPGLDSRDGGSTRAVTAICEVLGNAGVEISLWSTNWSAGGSANVVPTDTGRGSYQIELFDALPKFYARHLPGSRDLECALEARASEFDLVHVHSLWNPVASLALKICRKAGIAYVSSPHGMLDPVVFRRNAQLKWLWAKLLERHNVEGASLVHFTSAGERRAARVCGWKLPATVIAANPLTKHWRESEGTALGTDRCLPPNLDECAGHPWIVFVGRLSWVKNLPALIQGFAGLDDYDTPQLILVGPDTEGLARKLRSRARELGVERRVHFTGELSATQVQTILGRARVLTLVSEKENFGLAAVEALQVGVPVILSHGVNLDLDACPPLVQRVAPYPEAILAALKEITALELNRADLALGARRLGHELSDPTRISAALLQGYQDVLSDG